MKPVPQCLKQEDVAQTVFDTFKILIQRLKDNPDKTNAPMRITLLDEEYDVLCDISLIKPKLEEVKCE